MDNAKFILQQIKKREQKNRTYIIGIDGCGAAGKTSLANDIKKLDPDISVIHMDDFDLPTNGKQIGKVEEKEVGQDTDWRRMMREALLPLRNNQIAKYVSWDREKEKYTTTHEVKAGKIVIIEGVFATRNEIKDFYDFMIWMDCSRKTRLQRAIQRDGEGSRGKWINDWMPMEDTYKKSHKPHLRAHCIINESSITLTARAIK